MARIPRRLAGNSSNTISTGIEGVRKACICTRIMMAPAMKSAAPGRATAYMHLRHIIQLQILRPPRRALQHIIILCAGGTSSHANSRYRCTRLDLSYMCAILVHHAAAVAALYISLPRARANNFLHGPSALILPPAPGELDLPSPSLYWYMSLLSLCLLRFDYSTYVISVQFPFFN